MVATYGRFVRHLMSLRSWQRQSRSDDRANRPYGEAGERHDHRARLSRTLRRNLGRLILRYVDARGRPLGLKVFDNDAYSQLLMASKKH